MVGSGFLLSDRQLRCISNFAMKPLLACTIAGVLWATGAIAAGTATDNLIQSERQQQLLRTNTEKVSAQLRFLIEESQRNGIAGEELQTLQAIAAILDRLTDKEMQQVVELLQAARSAPNAGATQRNIVAAYSSQKNILVQMRQLVSEYRRQQELQEIANHFLALASRQGANLNQAVAFAESISANPSKRDKENQVAVLTAQMTEQEAISAEVKINLDRLSDFATQPANADVAEHVAKALEQVKTGKLLPALEGASAGLKEEQIYNAAGQEKAVRDQLRKLAYILIRPTDPADLLRQAKGDLENAIREERKVAEDADTLRGFVPTPFKQRLEDQQANLMDRVDLIRQDTANLAPAAAAKLKSAIAEMQRALAELRSPVPSSAQKTAQTAADKLAEAQAALQVEAEHAAPPPEAANPVAQLQQMDQQLKNLINDQAKLMQAGAAAPDGKIFTKQVAPQDKLQQDAQDLQRATAPVNPAIAQAMGDAAQQMQRASVKLAAAQNASAPQQAALDALQQARQKMQPELAKAEQAQAAETALENLLARLAKIILDQQRILLATGKIATAPDVLANTQGQVATATGAMQPEVTQQNPTAGSELAIASRNMEETKQALLGRQSSQAKSTAQTALEKLYQVKTLLEQQLSPKPEDAKAQAAAAAALDQAQKQIAQGLEELDKKEPGGQPNPEDPNPGSGGGVSQKSGGTPTPDPARGGKTPGGMQPAAQALQQAANTAGALAAAPQNGLPTSAQAAVQAAQQAAAQAAAQAANNQPGPAATSAAAAQAALAQAQAAMAMAAGMQPGQGQHPPSAGDGTGNFSNQSADGAVKTVTGQSAYLGLPVRDRQAIKQSQSEKYPEEYGAMIEQYLRNLADQSSQGH